MSFEQGVVAGLCSKLGVAADVGQKAGLAVPSSNGNPMLAPQRRWPSVIGNVRNVRLYTSDERRPLTPFKSATLVDGTKRS
jgi:hypothetical protein